MTNLTGWQWGGLIAAGAAVLWLWTQYANDPTDTSWTDPGQPPDMVPLAVGSSVGRIQRTIPYARTYPGSLSSWDGCVIGDC